MRGKLLNPVLVKLDRLDDINAKLDEIKQNVHVKSEEAVPESINDTKDNNIFDIDDRYVTVAPSIQNEVDLFKGDWFCKLPVEGVESGEITHFLTDHRIPACNELVPVAGKNILELGPYEGFHTYQLENHGAASVTSIESNKINFVKCLIVKNIFKLNAEYRLGDFMEYLNDCKEKYDIVLASGVLYNMADPIKMIRDLYKIADTLFISTFYYSKERTDLQHMFENTEPILLYSKYKVHKRIYEGRDAKSFCGSEKAYSMWPERETVLDALKDTGYTKVEIVEEVSKIEGKAGHSGNNMLIVAQKA